MAKRTINHALFNYVDSDGFARVAMRGETVDLPSEEAQRGDRLGAFNPTPTAPEAAPTRVPFPLDGDDAAQSAWMSEATAKEIQVEAALGDEVRAQMLEVEMRRGDAARKTVVAHLSTSS